MLASVDLSERSNARCDVRAAAVALPPATMDERQEVAGWMRVRHASGTRRFRPDRADRCVTWSRAVVALLYRSRCCASHWLARTKRPPSFHAQHQRWRLIALLIAPAPRPALAPATRPACSPIGLRPRRPHRPTRAVSAGCESATLRRRTLYHLKRRLADAAHARTGGLAHPCARVRFDVREARAKLRGLAHLPASVQPGCQPRNLLKDRAPRDPHHTAGV